MQSKISRNDGDNSIKALGEGSVVLCVEDDLGVLDALQMLLSQEGYRVIAARDVNEALAKVAAASPNAPPDAIITDYQLFGSDTGHALIQTLRRVAGRAVPALMLTADRAAERAADAQAVGYRVLYKPADAERLLQVLQELLASDTQ